MKRTNCPLSLLYETISIAVRDWSNGAVRIKPWIIRIYQTCSRTSWAARLIRNHRGKGTLGNYWCHLVKKITFTVYSATRKIADGSCASNILKCHYRSLTQKKNKCKEKCHKMIVSLPSHFSMRKLRKYLTSYVIKTH